MPLLLRRVLQQATRARVSERDLRASRRKRTRRRGTRTHPEAGLAVPLEVVDHALDADVILRTQSE